ncbi:beta-defensin 43-like [Dipodomys spectabilis]|uniref:beta-defensin 43-like n=1 Tax=Dipodomys spectabilis TaxID=105255 RepID=UPI001C536811|nr:beta-defensin 43-like [Dipodomys spectabilis]
MRALLSFLGAFALLSMLSPAACSTRYYSCRMKCNMDEYSVRYCEDWSICCKTKKSEIKRKKKW